MRIKEANIFGFGKWQQKKWQFDQDGVIQIIGENEAGKSTLRQFILYVLFGGKPREVEKFIPNDGAVVGGRLLVSGLSDEEITIERVYQKNKNKARVYFQDGSIADEDWLHQALHGMDRTHYESIFSFDSIDLQRIKSLHFDDLHEVLLTIGMIGSERIYEAEKKLDKDLQQLFKPYGKKPVINTILQQLKELKQKLAAAREQESIYEQRLSELEEMKATLQKLQIDRKKTEEKRAYFEKVHTYYSNIEEFYLLSQKRARIEAPATFPTEGIERLRHYKEAILPLKSEMQVIEKNIQAFEEEIAQTNLLSDQVYETLLEQQKLLMQMNECDSKISQLNDTLSIERRKLEEKLFELDLDQDADDIEEWPLSFQLEEEWTSMAKENEKIVIEESYIKAELQNVKNKDSAMKADIASYESKLLSKQERNKYESLLINHQETTVQAQQAEKYRRWKGQYKKRTKSFLMVSIPIFILAILLAVMIHPAFGYVGGSVILVIVGGFWLYGRAFSKWLQPEASIPSKKVLREEERIQIQQIIDEQQKLEAQISEFQKEKVLIQREIIQLEERLQAMERQKFRLERRIEDQIAEFPFLQSIPVAQWPKLYPELRRLKEMKRAIVQLETEVTKQVEEKQALEARLVDDFPVELAAVEVRIDEEKQQREMVQIKKNQLDQLVEQYENLLEKIKPYQTEIQQLLIVANVDSEETFIRLGEKYREAKGIEEKLKQIEDSLSILFSEADVEQWRMGNVMDKQTLVNQLDNMKEQLNELDKSIEDKQKQLSDKKAAISVLEKSVSSSVIRYELAMKQEELRHYAFQWAAQKYALTSLEQTKDHFSKKYLPMVLESASSYFQRLTLGNYHRMFFDEDEQALKAEHNDGFIYSISSLSQGSLDQFYIALRLGLAEVTSAQFRLPFLIDDGFVHFDRHRKEQMIEILKELSDSHQIIYFSTVPLDSHAITL